MACSDLYGVLPGPLGQIALALGPRDSKRFGRGGIMRPALAFAPASAHFEGALKMVFF